MPETSVQQLEEAIPVRQIWKELGGKVSIRHIYNLIERGEFGEGVVFRFAGSRGTCVKRWAVLAYKERCLVEVGK